MKELLMNYSGVEILMFLVALSAAVKGVVSFYDWAAERLMKVFNKKTQKEKNKEEIIAALDNNSTKIQALSDSQALIIGDISKLQNSINELTDSDKDDIKAWITEKHHYYCYELGYIDDYSLDCIEKRYSHYLAFGGNSFVADLMQDLRKLEKRPNRHQLDR